MPQSELRLIRRCAELLPKSDIEKFPRGLRGIYVLYMHNRRNGPYNVVYVGMAAAGRRGGIKGRLRAHQERKGDLWTHFSLFEVWDNIRDEEVHELEGLFRHLYRLDARANRLNVQGGFKKLGRLRVADVGKWPRPASPSGRRGSR